MIDRGASMPSKELKPDWTRQSVTGESTAATRMTGGGI